MAQKQFPHVTSSSKLERWDLDHSIPYFLSNLIIYLLLSFLFQIDVVMRWLVNYTEFLVFFCIDVGDIIFVALMYLLRTLDIEYILNWPN